MPWHKSLSVRLVIGLTLGFSVIIACESHAQVLETGNAMPANAGGIDPNSADTNSIDSASFDRGGNISVRQRPRPDYQAEGVPAGGFMVYPKISFAVAYDDNIYALQDGAVGDAIFTQTPEIDVQSTWARNALSAYVKAQQDEFISHSGEDATQYGAGLAGKYQFGNSQLNGGVDYAHEILPRSASNNVGFSEHPIPYDYAAANAEVESTFTRVRLSLRFDEQNYEYQNGQTPFGSLVDEDQYNRNALTVTSKAEVAVSPSAAVYLTASGNDRDYQLNVPGQSYSQDNDGYEVDAGANFDLTHLIRGEIQLGYLNQSYRASLVYRPISGPSAKVQIQWFPTQLTTVTAVVTRAVGDAGVPGSAGFLLSNGSLQVDHELLRNLILTAQASYGGEQYNGIDRTDDLASAGISANWLLTRHVGLTLAYTYTDQSSSGAEQGPSYQDNRLLLSANLQY